MERDEFDSFFSGMSTLSKRLKKINSEIETNVNLNPNSARYNYWAGNISAYMLISKVHNPLKWFGIPWTVKKTKAFFEKAVELDPNHHEARAFLIRIYHGGLFLGSHSKKSPIWIYCIKFAREFQNTQTARTARGYIPNARNCGAAGAHALRTQYSLCNLCIA